MNDDASSPVELRWEVTSDLIDLDRWGRAFVEVSTTLRRDRSSFVTRHAVWIIGAIILAALALTRDLALLIPAVTMGVVLAAVLLWNRGAAGRMTKKLRALPTASEPFTLAADAHGTHSTAASSSGELAWSRYRDAVLLDDLLVLVLDTDFLTMVPRAALVTPCPPDAEVTIIKKWIDATVPAEPEAPAPAPDP